MQAWFNERCTLGDYARVYVGEARLGGGGVLEFGYRDNGVRLWTVP